MRKRKAPIAAVFFLVLLIAVAAFFNMQGGAAGVYNPDVEQHEMDQQQAAQEAPPQSDAARRGEMQEHLQGQGKGPLSPNAQEMSPAPLTR
ncbi:MAG: hypothetical protein JNK63_00225 [Chthonomonas sp.]|nr:hypothetical protein [Chthonomonas sp.]